MFLARCVMADVSGLVAAVEARAVAIFDDAVDGMRQRVDEVVPIGEPDYLGRPSFGPRLRDTFFRTPTEVRGAVISADIGYSAPQAFYSNNLQPRHWIPSRGRYPLRFWWDNPPAELGGPGEYRFMRVDHPGNVNSRSLGWWDKTIDGGSWTLELDASTALVSS